MPRLGGARDIGALAELDFERDQWERDFVQFTEGANSITRRKGLIIGVAVLIPYLCRLSYPTRAAKAALVAVLLSICATVAWIYQDALTPRRRPSKKRKLVEIVVRMSLQVSVLMLAPLVYRYIDIPDNTPRAFLVASSPSDLSRT